MPGWIAWVLFCPAIVVFLSGFLFYRYTRHANGFDYVFGVYTLAWIIIDVILGWIPILGILISVLLGIAWIGLAVFLMFKAYQGVEFKVKWAGDFAEKWVSRQAK